MSTAPTHSPGRSSSRPGRLALSALAVTLTSALTITALGLPAQANPGDGSPGGNFGVGDVWITSSTAVAKGQRLSFAGEGFAAASTNPDVYGQLSLKLDAASSTDLYTGTATNGSTDAVIDAFQVQGDGTVSGSLIVPDDIDSAAVNPASHAGPHFLRFLTAGTSRWSDDFTVDAAATPAPVVSVTATTATSRGTTTVSLAVTGSGFKPDEVVTVARAQDEGTALGTVTADASGVIVGTATTGKISLPVGTLLAGEHQLVFKRANTADLQGIAQVEVKPVFAVANANLGGAGTVSILNGAANARYGSVTLDPSPDVTGDEVEVLTGALSTDATGAGSGDIAIPDAVANLGTKTFVATRTAPFAESSTFQAKVSPSAALLGEAGYDRVETAKGAIQQGLYQSAYSARSKSLFATSASVKTTSTIYKLDPDTLAVRASVVPAEEAPGALWAAYGVGVDDTHGTVWVTNTRQNTVAVYAQDDLSLLAQLPAGILSHTRDVVADPKHGVVYVSSASEGSSGNGSIGVFEADDKNGNGIKYEMIEQIAQQPRSYFSPMSLELDEATNKLITVSNTSQRAYVYDTETGAENYIELPDIANVTARGASGAAYDGVTHQLFVATQASDELLIAKFNDDFTAASTVAEVPTGAGALNVHFDPVKRLAYVANFGGTTITVVDPAGTKVANLPLNRPNHVSVGPNGTVYAVNKDTDNIVVRLSPKAPVVVKPKPNPVVLKTLKSVKPKLKGKFKVRKKIKVKTGKWTAGTTLTYKWLVNGKAVKGKKGKKATLKLTKAMKGKKVAVKVTGTKTGYQTVTKKSAAKRVKR